MIGTKYTLTNKANPSLSVVFNDHSGDNFIALQAYPVFDLEVRNDEILREGQHGTWDFFSYYGKRVITFEGVIIGIDEAEVTRLKDMLLKVTELPGQPTESNNGTILISWTDPLGRDVQAEARIATPIRFNRGLRQLYKLDFLLTLKSGSTAIQSQEEFTNSGERGYILGGMTIPFSMPFSLVDNAINRLEVDNTGNASSPFKVRMYGTASMVLTNPKITNLTTGAYMQIDITLADETEYIEIDSKTGTVLDQGGIDRSANIHSGSVFVNLAPGINNLLYSTDESYGATGPEATRVDPQGDFSETHRFNLL